MPVKLFTLIFMLCSTGCAIQPVARPSLTPVFFQPFSVSLDPAAITAIADAARSAKRTPGLTILLIGSADNTGTSDSNQALAKARAEAVLSQMVFDGVAKSRLHAEGTPGLGALSDMTQFDRRVIIKFED